MLSRATPFVVIVLVLDQYHHFTMVLEWAKYVTQASTDSAVNVW